jgi:hypothetical protein
MKYGNKDTEQKFDLSALNIPEDRFVVRHFSHVKLANGQDMEDPTTSRIQVYTKETFADLSRQPVVKGVQQKSKFEENGLNYEVLHDPTEEGAKKDASGNKGGSESSGGIKQKNVKEVVALIEAALDEAEVDAIVKDNEIAGKERKGVLDAADKKKNEFLVG